MVKGSETPLTLNAELLLFMALTVTLAPLAVSFPDAVPLVPTTASPTATLLGETASCPAEPEEFDEFDEVELLTPWQPLIRKETLSKDNAASPRHKYLATFRLSVVRRMRI